MGICSPKCASVGQMNHRVVIQKPTATTSATGEATITWTDYAVRWFFLRPMRTSEVVQSEQVQGAVGWIGETQYDSKTKAITSDMRLKVTTYDNRILNCDGPSMPVDGGKQNVRVRAIEHTQ